ncbi:MAG: hypothetical protein H7Y13_14295, partial [Sphingobacteriaceae bacterium]|nr:hypothetical protein [Sphingobacteriaceae bacterium]
PGVLNIDVWHAWPKKAELLIGDYAEAWPVNKKLKYEIVGDGKLLKSDSLGTWILGKSDFSIDLKNLNNLQLKTYTDRKGNTANTLFWANARIVISSGKIIRLTELKTKAENIIPIVQSGKDYKGGPVRIAGDGYTDIAAAEPENTNKPGIITLDLNGLNAVKLIGLIGGDWVVGNEEQLRKTVSFRTSGKQARYLTVLEPYEDKSLVKKVTALSADELHIELSDGRTQHIKIDQLGGKADALGVKITEEKNGKIIREEESINK